MTTPTPRLSIPLAWQMTLNLTQGGQPAAVVLGAVQGSPSVFPVTADFEAFRNKAWTMVRGISSSTVTCTGAIVRSTNTGTPSTIELGPPASPTGAGTPPDAVAAAAVCLKWKTGNGTRSGKGRTFVPGLPQANVASDGRTLTAATVTNAQNMINAYLANPGALVPAVLSFKTGAAHQILSGAPAGIIGIQRRRMR